MHISADFYADPLVYDVLHAPGTAQEARALLRVVKRYMPITPPLSVLEPACGTGRLLINLAKKGHSCIGFDLSGDMVAFAGAAAKEAGVAERLRVFEADMRDFDAGQRLPKVHIAFNPINTIRHLETDAAVLEHFAAVGRVLAPGGIYIVGLSLCAYGLEVLAEDVWTGKGRGLNVTQVAQYFPATGERGGARIERVVSHMTVRDGVGERHIDSRYTLRGYNLAQWQAIATRAGFAIRGVFANDGEPMEPSEPGYFLFVLSPIAS